MGAGKIRVHRQIANLDYIVTNGGNQWQFCEYQNNQERFECAGGEGIWKELYGV